MQERHANFYFHIIGQSIKRYETGQWGLPFLMFPTSKESANQNHGAWLLNSIYCFINEGVVKIYNIGSIYFEAFYGQNIRPNYKLNNLVLYTKFFADELNTKIQKK